MTAAPYVVAATGKAPPFGKVPPVGMAISIVYFGLSCVNYGVGSSSSAWLRLSFSNTPSSYSYINLFIDAWNVTLSTLLSISFLRGSIFTSIIFMLLTFSLSVLS